MDAALEMLTSRIQMCRDTYAGRPCRSCAGPMVVSQSIISLKIVGRGVYEVLVSVACVGCGTGFQKCITAERIGITIGGEVTSC